LEEIITSPSLALYYFLLLFFINRLQRLHKRRPDFLIGMDDYAFVGSRFSSFLKY